MAWFEGVLEVAGAQFSPGGTSLGLSTPMASDLRHTASVLGRPATVGGGAETGGVSLPPTSAKTMWEPGGVSLPPSGDIVPKPRFFTTGFQF